MRGWRSTLLISGIGLATLVTACHGGPHPTFTVDSGLDIGDAVPGDGTCDTGTGICTLRAAIDESNALVGEDTATIELTTDVDLSILGTLDDTNATGDLDITHTVTINGQGHTIDANQLDRVIDHHTGDLTIVDTTITGGNASGGPTPSGGGVQSVNAGALTLLEASISSNTAAEGGGGVMFFGGEALTVVNSSLSFNHIDDGHGGGISIEHPEADARIAGTVISNNSATMAGYGAGLSASVWYRDGIALTISDSAIADNTTVGAFGGIVTSGFSTLIERTTISGNTAGAYAALSHSAGGTFTLVDSTVSNNTTTVLGMWALIDETEGFEISRTTFAGNTSANGYGLSLLLNTPLNQGTTAYSGTIRSSTITGESSEALLSVGESFYPAHVDIIDSVVANESGDACHLEVDLYYTFVPPVSLGHNWYTDSTCAPIVTDIVGPDPLLGALQNNGGPTHTMLPLAGSPLLDAIPWNTAGACDATTPTDQRGLPRPAAAATNCDIGAAERQPADP